MKSTLFYVAAGLAVCSVATSSFAAELWGTDVGSRPTIELSQINSTTGAVISTTSVGTGLATANTDDLASDPVREPSVLWGVRWSAFVNQLVSIDPFQNTVLSSIQLTSPTPIRSVAIDPTDGVLYGAGGTSLFQIARDTGTTTLVGAGSNSPDKALGFDSAGNLFGIAANNALLAIDKFTGATNPIATLSAGMVDIAANPETGIMYGLGGTYNLYQIDLATGALTTVGPSLSRPSSLAFTAQLSPIGDFNGDAIVDARDYAVWRKRLGTTYTPSDYNTWRAHFGQSPLGTGTTLDASAPVPEPTMLALLLPAAAFAFFRRSS